MLLVLRETGSHSVARSGNHIWSASGQPNVTLWHGIAEDSSAWGVEAKLIVACCKTATCGFFNKYIFEPFCIHDSHLGKGVFEKFQPCRRKGLRELRVREWNHISTFVEPVEPYLFNQNCILRRTGTAGTASMPSGWSPSFSGDSGNCPSGRNHIGSLGCNTWHTGQVIMSIHKLSKFLVTTSWNFVSVWKEKEWNIPEPCANEYLLVSDWEDPETEHMFDSVWSLDRSWQLRQLSQGHGCGQPSRQSRSCSGDGERCHCHSCCSGKGLSRDLGIKTRLSNLPTRPRN